MDALALEEQIVNYVKEQIEIKVEIVFANTDTMKIHQKCAKNVLIIVKDVLLHPFVPNVLPMILSDQITYLIVNVYLDTHKILKEIVKLYVIIIYLQILFLIFYSMYPLKMCFM